MANFSDDDTEKLDAIIGQRKRKGTLEYLVRWGGEGDRSERWESATSIGSDYAKAIQNFLESRKSEKKRSTSRSRKVSRSRSRSSSRNRKSPSREKTKSKSRSQSRGRPRKSENTPMKNDTSEVDGNITPNTSHRNTRSRSSIVITNSNFEGNITAATFPEEKTTEMVESKSIKESDIMAAQTSKPQLEVQRAHNERCLARDDDKNPRSVIWRLADYAVIFLFTVSLIAVIFLFLEKIIDLEEFKSQAFPNMLTLKTRLSDGVKSLTDSAFYQLERVGDFWLYMTQQPQKSSA